MSGVSDLIKAQDVNKYGGKAANLAALLKAGLPVPDGLAVSIDAFHDGKLTSNAKTEIEEYLNRNLDKLFAVRSSALAEDAEDASWAGQFETFLDTKTGEVIKKVEECHTSAKRRAKAYAAQKAKTQEFKIAVVVQEMLQPEYAGVLFTKDPVTGEDKFVTEYVEGLGEKLVSGLADPEQISWTVGEKVKAPFSIEQLTDLAQKAEQTFGRPQDIEWAWADDKMWLVQARPITTPGESEAGYGLGEPEELFYWGPSRAKPLYMSDFMIAVEQFFEILAGNEELPNPPKTLVLFHEDKNVWLINAHAFADFTEKLFIQYNQQRRFKKDYKNWRTLVKKNKRADVVQLAEVQKSTLFAEFSLYGAESAITKKLQRFSHKDRQRIWGAFTYPDKPTFLNSIDEELYEAQDPKTLANKYPWINDGYRGVSGKALTYFEKRLKIVNDNPPAEPEAVDRSAIAQYYKLSAKEVSELDLARQLAKFMDERKAWMMQSRRGIKKLAGKVKNGWFFDGKKARLVGAQEVAEFWERYIEFKSAGTALSGLVASNGGRHFVNGEVRVVLEPTQSVEDDMILAVPSTSPSYVPLMRKARALITDHGGMMSHAAIVGREFNLPCIVGTKTATNVLKNGDKVVLDLVKGEVNK